MTSSGDGGKYSGPAAPLGLGQRGSAAQPGQDRLASSCRGCPVLIPDGQTERGVRENLLCFLLKQLRLTPVPLIQKLR